MKTTSIIVGFLVLTVMVVVAIMAKDIMGVRPPLQPISPAPRTELSPPKSKAAPKVSEDEERKEWTDEKAAREAALPKEEEILSITRSLDKPYYYDEIGKYWMRKLDDESVHGAQRNVNQSEAANFLGILKYPPAIPILIKHVELVSIGIGYTEGDPDANHVVKRALGEYGNAAVPAVIEAYLDTADSNRRAFLQGAIESGRTHKFASTYLDGLHAQGDKRVTDKDLEFFHGLK